MSEDGHPAGGKPITDESNTFGTLFTVQPLDEKNSIVRVCAALDTQPAPDAAAVRARGDIIFNQDKDIVESQRPERIPTQLRYELHHRQPEFDHRQYHHTWLDYLYWDSELES